MVDVFKTDVQDDAEAAAMISALREHLPGGRIHFDLEDSDRILRIESAEIDASLIVAVLGKNGFRCEALPD